MILFSKNGEGITVADEQEWIDAVLDAKYNSIERAMRMVFIKHGLRGIRGMGIDRMLLLISDYDFRGLMQGLQFNMVNGSPECSYNGEMTKVLSNEYGIAQEVVFYSPTISARLHVRKIQFASFLDKNSHVHEIEVSEMGIMDMMDSLEEDASPNDNLKDAFSKYQSLIDKEK